MPGDDPARDLEQILGDALRALLPALIETERGRLHRLIAAHVERIVLAAVLAASAGNQLEAARILGINRNTLRKRLRLLGLAPRSAPVPNNWAAAQTGGNATPSGRRQAPEKQGHAARGG